MHRGHTGLARKFSWPFLFGVMLVVTLGLGAAGVAAKGGKGGGKPGDDPTPVPNPDMVYSRSGTIYLATANGSTSGNLGVSGYAPHWLPDGSGIVYYSDVVEPGMYFLQIDDSAGTAVGTPKFLFPAYGGGGDGGHLTRPSLSEVPSIDGMFKYIFSNVELIGEGPVGQADLIIINEDGSDRVNLTSSRYFEDIGIFAPTADRIVHAKWGEPSDLFMVDLVINPSTNRIEFGSATSLFPPGSPLHGEGAGVLTWPTWANTRDEIVVAAKGDLWIIPVSNPTLAYNITNTPNVEEMYPEFSSDDSQVYYTRYGDPLCGESVKGKNKALSGTYRRNVDGALVDGCEEQKVFSDSVIVDLRN